MIKILQTLYESLTTALSETPEDVIKLILDVRQGGPESPPLYHLFMDYVMRIYRHQCEEEDIKFITCKYCIRSTSPPRERRGMKSYRGEHAIFGIVF